MPMFKMKKLDTITALPEMSTTDSYHNTITTSIDTKQVPI